MKSLPKYIPYLQYSIKLLNTMAKNPKLHKKLYLIGDSNTQFAFSGNGFASKLANEYIRRVDVINRGFSGYTSENLHVMFSRMINVDNSPLGSVHTATILLGSNDSVDPALDSRHVTVQRYKENIEYIIKALRDEQVVNIVLLSPPPVDHEKWNQICMDRYGSPGSNTNISVKPYADVCLEIATNLNVHYVDLYNGIMSIENWEDYFGDGLHFSEKGNDYVFEKLKETLDPLLTKLEMIYPDWKEIDRTCMDQLLR